MMTGRTPTGTMRCRSDADLKMWWDRKAIDELAVKGIPMMGERFVVQFLAILVSPLYAVKYEARLVDAGYALEPGSDLVGPSTG